MLTGSIGLRRNPMKFGNESNNPIGNRALSLNRNVQELKSLTTLAGNQPNQALLNMFETPQARKMLIELGSVFRSVPSGRVADREREAVASSRHDNALPVVFRRTRIPRSTGG